MMTRSLPEPGERVARPGVGPDDDAEVEPEEGPQLALPVAHEPGGRDDQDPSQEASGEHLADVEPGHDGLARPRLIAQEKAEAGLRQHVVVDRDPLVGQRVDHRDFGREGGVEEMGEGQPLPFGDDADHFRIGGKVEGLRLRDITCNSQKIVLMAIAGFIACFHANLAFLLVGSFRLVLISALTRLGDGWGTAWSSTASASLTSQ